MRFSALRIPYDVQDADLMQKREGVKTTKDAPCDGHRDKGFGSPIDLTSMSVGKYGSLKI